MVSQYKSVSQFIHTRPVKKFPGVLYIYVLVSPVEWHPSTPSTTLHSCAGLHSHGSHVMLLFPLHLQRSEQSFSSNQVSPAYMNMGKQKFSKLLGSWVLCFTKYLKKMNEWGPYHYIITTTPLLAHLQVDNSHPHQCSRTHQLERICPHWEPDHCHRSIPLHRACHIRCQSLQGPGSLVGDRQDRKVHSDCPMDILELYWRKISDNFIPQFQEFQKALKAFTDFHWGFRLGIEMGQIDNLHTNTLQKYYTEQKGIVIEKLTGNV